MSKRQSRSTFKLGLVAALAALASLALAGSALAAPPSGPPTQDAFVIGDGNAQVGAHVTFWGAQWWKKNDLSGGVAPASFKGYAKLADLSCSQDWMSWTGNSSHPPASVGSTVKALVATHVQQSGAVVSGDGTQVALIAPDAGYSGNPGHPGTGVVLELDSCGFGGGIFGGTF